MMQAQLEVYADSAYNAAMATDLLSLGKRIKAEREAQGLTQRDLSTRASFEQTRLSKLESGKSHPGLEALERLCKALGKSLAWLLEQTETASPPQGMTVEAAELARLWQALPDADRAAVRRIVVALGRRDTPKD